MSCERVLVQCLHRLTSTSSTKIRSEQVGQRDLQEFWGSTVWFMSTSRAHIFTRCTQRCRGNMLT